jgi:cold shock protein
MTVFALCRGAGSENNLPILRRRPFEVNSSSDPTERVSTMATGTVKWFNDAKGFGFITPDDGGEDIFCHHTAVKMDGFRTVAEGQKVQFDVSRGPKGLQASNVTVIG